MIDKPLANRSSMIFTNPPARNPKARENRQKREKSQIHLFCFTFIKNCSNLERTLICRVFRLGRCYSSTYDDLCRHFVTFYFLSWCSCRNFPSRTFKIPVQTLSFLFAAGVIIFFGLSLLLKYLVINKIEKRLVLN